MKLKINVNYLICFLMCAIFSEPLLFKEPKYTSIDQIFTILKIVCFAMLSFYIISRKRYNKSMLIVIAFELTIFLSTIVHSGNLIKFFGPAVNTIGFTLIVSYYFPRIKINFVKIMYHVLVTFNLINFASVMLFPDGIILNSVWSKVYFLGIENRFVFYMIPMIFYGGVYSLYNNNKLSVGWYINLGISIFTLIRIWSVGAMIGIIIFATLIVCFSKVKSINKIDFKYYLIIIIVLNVLLVFFSVQSIFSDFIVNTLQKDITLSGRTLIWDNAKEVIRDNWFIGIGVQPDAYLKSIFYGVVHTHNLALNILIQSGFLGLFIFLRLLLYIDTNSKKIQNSRIKFFMNATIFTILLMSLVDTIDIGLIFSMYLVNIMYSEVLENGKEQNRDFNIVQVI